MIPQRLLLRLRSNSSRLWKKSSPYSTNNTAAAFTTASPTMIQSPQHAPPRRQTLFSKSSFSTESATSTNTTPSNTDENSELKPFIPSQFTRDRPSSILTQTYPSGEYTPGQAWSTLQIHLAGGEQIRHSDFESVCNATRSQSPKDAKLIVTMLKDLKRCNRFIVSEDLAKSAVDGMYRSLLPAAVDSDETDSLNQASGFYKVQCGLMIGEAFVKEKTGLYVSLDTDVVESKVLKPLYLGLMDLQSTLKKRGDVASATSDATTTEDNEDTEDAATEDDGDNDSDSDSDTDSDSDSDSVSDSESGYTIQEKNQHFIQKTTTLLSKTTNLSKQIFDTLLTRASTPTKDMKKRAKRKYLKYSQCSGGPSPTSIDTMVRICLLQVEHEMTYGTVSGEEEEQKTENGIVVAKSILDAYEETPFIGKALDETFALVKEMEQKYMEHVAATTAESESSEEEGEEQKE